MKADLEEVRALTVLALGCPGELVTPAARLKEDLGADSFGLATLAAVLEDYWGLTMPDGVFEHLQTLEEMADYCYLHRSRN